MRKPEQRLWDRMRHNLKGSGIWLERIENGVGEGHPDVEATSYGAHTVIELKMVEKFPFKRVTRVLGPKGLNPKQLNWWLEANKYGRRGIIIVGVGITQLALEGKHSEAINEMNAYELSTTAFATSWRDIEAYLKGYK